MNTWTLRFDQEGLALLNEALMNMPFGRVLPMSQSINQQIQAQNTEAQQTAQKAQDAAEAETEAKVQARIDEAVATAIAALHEASAPAPIVVDSDAPLEDPQVSVREPRAPQPLQAVN